MCRWFDGGVIPSPSPSSIPAVIVPSLSPSPIAPSPAAEPRIRPTRGRARTRARRPATARSAGLAIWALYTARTAERRSIDRLVDERRCVFELEILRELAEQLDGAKDPLKDKWRTRLAMLPEDELSYWRLIVSNQWLPEGVAVAAIRAEDAESVRLGLAPQGVDEGFVERQALRAQLLEAIGRRMKERGD